MNAAPSNGIVLSSASTVQTRGLAAAFMTCCSAKKFP